MIQMMEGRGIVLLCLGKVGDGGVVEQFTEVRKSLTPHACLLILASEFLSDRLLLDEYLYFLQ